MRRIRTRLLYYAGPIALAASGLSLQACKSDQRANAPSQNVTTQSTPTASPLTGFARDLQFVRNGQYAYILVFARKDGKPIDKEDGAFLRKNAPQVVDWVATDGGKRVIGGTNFNFEEGGMEVLKKRFQVEDYSSK